MTTPRSSRPARRWLLPFPSASASSSAEESLDQARERAARLLTDRYATGALDDAGLDWRLSRLYSADDAVAIEAVVRDLRDPLAATPFRKAEVPATMPAERRILAVMGETRRKGRWEVAQRMVVRALMGEVKLDVRDAPIGDGFTLDVRAVMSRVTLIVPPGVSVLFDVFAMAGNAINDAHEFQPGRAGVPVIRVVGGAYLGEVRVLVRERGR
jgi:hypothetical protein